MKRNPAPAIITGLSSLWDRINQWLGRSQAEQAKAQADLQFKTWEAEQLFTIEREKMALEDARERERMDREFALAAQRVMDANVPSYQPGGALDR